MIENFFQQLIVMFDHKGIPAWVYGPVAALLWGLSLSLVKRIILRHFEKLANFTVTQVDNLIIKSVSLPLTLIIWGSAAAILGKMLPAGDRWAWITAGVFHLSLVLALVLTADRICSGLLTIYSDKTKALNFSPQFLRGVIRGIILGLGLLIFLDTIGISITPILASLGIGSLAVAMGLQSTLTNFFAGMLVMADKSIRVGDYVKLASGEEGYVTEITWHSTRIQMLQNNTVVVPNSQLVSNVVTNYYLPSKDLAVLVPVGVHYSSDLEHVERVTIEVAREVLKKVQGGVPEFDPFIRFGAFSDSSVNFTVILRGKEFVDQYLVKHEFIKALHKRYQKESIVIPFPIRTLEVPRDTIEELRQAVSRQ